MDDAILRRIIHDRQDRHGTIRVPVDRTIYRTSLYNQQAMNDDAIVTHQYHLWSHHDLHPRQHDRSNLRIHDSQPIPPRFNLHPFLCLIPFTPSVTIDIMIDINLYQPLQNCTHRHDGTASLCHGHDWDEHNYGSVDWYQLGWIRGLIVDTMGETDGCLSW